MLFLQLPPVHSHRRCFWEKKTCVRGADATDFAFTTLRLNRTCLLRLYFRSVALSISTQSLSSSILLFIAMFTFCLTLHITTRMVAFGHLFGGDTLQVLLLHSSCTSILVFFMGFHEALSRPFVLSAAMRLSQ